MSFPAHRRISYDEYLEIDQDSASHRFEFVDGVVYAMTGGSPDHAALILELGAQFRNQLRGKRCRPYSSDLRIRVPKGDAYYPDLAVVCGKLELDADNTRYPKTALNPTLLVEVLSPSTRDYDRGEKLLAYTTIPGLQEVLFVDPEERAVHVWRMRAEDPKAWVQQTFWEIGGSMPVLNFAVKIDLVELFDVLRPME